MHDPLNYHLYCRNWTSNKDVIVIYWTRNIGPRVRRKIGYNGDINTNTFKIATMKRQENLILKINDESGNYFVGQDDICKSLSLHLEGDFGRTQNYCP